METKNRRKWTLVELPDHQGVVNVGGRLGAALGPDAFFKAFTKIRGRFDPLSCLAQRGTLEAVSKNVKSNHKLAIMLVEKMTPLAPVSIIVGGGHDLGYCHLKGIKNALPDARIGCINLDAHLDLRRPDPEITSGSPFYLALEDGTIAGEDLIEFGIQDHCNSDSLWNYAAERGVKIVAFRECFAKPLESFKKCLSELEKRCDKIVISLDLDCLIESSAPGVSAPQAIGFNSSDIDQILCAAAFCDKVCSLGIFELNPHHDIDDKTARLAAIFAYGFLNDALAQEVK